MENPIGTQALFGASIPINQVLAAAKDAELRALLRQRETARKRVERAIAAVAKTEQEIATYCAQKYPAPDTPEAA